MYQQNLTNQPCPHNVPHSPLRSKFTRPAGSLSRRTHVPHFLFPETAWGTFDLTASELLTMQFLFSMFQVQNRPFGVWALRSAQACWTKGGNFFILFKMLTNLIVQFSKLDCTSLLVDNVGLNNDIVARVVRALIYQASWEYLLSHVAVHVVDTDLQMIYHCLQLQCCDFLSIWEVVFTEKSNWEKNGGSRADGTKQVFWMVLIEKNPAIVWLTIQICLRHNMQQTPRSEMHRFHHHWQPLSVTHLTTEVWS